MWGGVAFREERFTAGGAGSCGVALLRKLTQWVKAIVVAAAVGLIAGLVAMLLVDLAVSGYGVWKAVQADGIGEAVGQIESQTIIGLVQGVATIVAIAIGGAFAYYRLGLFRQTEPHLTISQEVSHRRTSDEYLQVGISVTLRNTSNVKVEIHRAFCRLSQIAPLAPSYVTATMSEQHLAWPILSEILDDSESAYTIVEPGESSHVVYQFVVSPLATSLLIHTFVYNEQYSGADSGRSQGWQAYTFYDVVG